MHFSTALLLAPLVAARSPTIVLSNDDGWAELNIRTFYNALVGFPFHFNVLLSAPSENKSGTGSTDVPPTVLNITCEFDTCPVGSPAEGFNASMPRFNYVNSFPVPSIRFGLQTLAPKLFGTTRGRPNVDIAVAGFNVGNNLGNITLISGTVGAATEAAKEGFPAIAFSGATGTQVSYTTPIVPNNTYAPVYGALSAELTNAVIFGKPSNIFDFFTPLLPKSTYLNVNLPPSNATFCPKVSQFKYVLTRINQTPVNASTPPDVFHCGSLRLPDETTVLRSTKGCFVTVSVGDAVTKGDVGALRQFEVLERIRGIFTCPPKVL